MFRGLINDAKSAATSLVAKYLARASVAVPFVVAVGFATAAITLMLVERFGHIAAYWMVAGGFLAIGLVATLTVKVKEQEEEIAEQQAEASDTAGVSTDAAAQAAAQLPIAALGALFTVPGGPAAALGGMKALARHWPILIMAALIAAMFWPTAPANPETHAAAPPDDDDALDPTLRNPSYAAPASNGLHREAA